MGLVSFICMIWDIILPGLEHTPFNLAESKRDSAQIKYSNSRFMIAYQQTLKAVPQTWEGQYSKGNWHFQNKNGPPISTYDATASVYPNATIYTG